MKKKRLMFILGIAAVVVALIVAGYFIYFYSGQCFTQECFQNSLVKCERSFYFKDTPQTIMQYSINGKSGNNCMVGVNLLQVKKGTVELSPLEGKSMVCAIPFGIMMQPEENLKLCHGILKEEIQELIITRMHAQIVENLGKISEETTKIL